MSKVQALVADTSLLVKWFSSQNERDIDRAKQILEDCQRGRVEIFAPELAKYEVGNVLRYGKKFTVKEAALAQKLLYSLPIVFVPESIELAQETYRLADSLEITYYDAAFLALARTSDALLVTDNVKHQGKGKSVKVVPIQEYE